MLTRKKALGRICGVGMAAVVGMASLPRATAQDAETLTVEVSDCAELASPEARLACFDAQVEAARRTHPGPEATAPRARAPAPVPEATAPSARAPAPAPEATAPSARAPAPVPEVRSEPARTAAPVRSSNERRDRRESESVEFMARVAELRETVPNSYVITLDNGQVWRQTRPLYYPLRPGHEVRIYTQGRFGQRLTNRELRGFIAVERVR